MAVWKIWYRAGKTGCPWARAEHHFPHPAQVSPSPWTRQEVLLHPCFSLDQEKWSWLCLEWGSIQMKLESSQQLHSLAHGACHRPGWHKEKSRVPVGAQTLWSIWIPRAGVAGCGFTHHGKDKQLPHRMCTNPLHVHFLAQAGDFLVMMNQVFLVL